MQSLHYIKLIIDYNYWANHKLWSSVMTISEDDFKQSIDYGLGSLHRHMVHMMWAESAKLSRIQAKSPINWTVSDFPMREAIIEQWLIVEADYRKYLANLTINELNREILKHNQTQPIYEILLHVVNHSTDHRAQMLRMIGDFGGQTFSQDMVYYFRELRANQ